jgi:hypothetical protein
MELAPERYTGEPSTGQAGFGSATAGILLLTAKATPTIRIAADPLTVRMEPSCASRGALAKTWVPLVWYMISNLCRACSKP